ncbi:MAG: M23 family metallopeptidase, partial [Chloroflexota bacterium]
MEATSWWLRPVAPGTVTLVQNYRIEIDHGNGWQSMYYHVSTIKVSVNQQVGVDTDMGHPSCYPAGSASGRSVHLVLRRDSSWIDFRSTATTLSGWEVKPGGKEGEGTLYRDGISIGIYGSVPNDRTSPTPTSTPTPARTVTPAPSPARTPTHMPTATRTPTPTATPTSTPASSTGQIHLSQGWSLISIPGPQQDPAVGAVFAQSPAITKICSYRDGQWDNAYRGAGGWTGPLTSIVDGTGYLVYATAATTLVLQPKLPDPLAFPPSYSLARGWNMIGYTSSAARIPVDIYLSSVQGNWMSLYRFDSTIGWDAAKPGGWGFR